MTRPTSLTLRLTLLFSIVAAAVLSSFGWFIESSIEQHFIDGDAAELEIIAQTVSETLLNNAATKRSIALKQRFQDVLVGHHGAVLYIAQQGANTLFQSHKDLDFSTLNFSTFDKNQTSKVQNWSNSNHTFRVLTRRLVLPNPPNSTFPNSESSNNVETTYTISVAVAIDHHQRFLNFFQRTLWIMVGIGIFVTGLMGWFAVRQGHAPLHNIVSHIQQISANELNTRLSPESVPKELTDLAVSFNEMLERMEKAFLRLQNFSADIAHELRTPVTSLLTQTQVALSKTRSTDEYREILYSNVEEYERMAQMIGDMLFLAKADNGLFNPNTIDIELRNEVQELIDYYELWADELGVSLMIDGNAKVPADRQILRRAIGNLLSNAIRHTPRGEKVRVLLNQTSNQTVLISVENPGEMIPSEHIPRLFDRFYRVNASRHSDSVGLGLAIVKSIIEIHQGKIEVHSSEKSTRFEITLPASAATQTTNGTETT